MGDGGEANPRSRAFGIIKDHLDKHPEHQRLCMALTKHVLTMTDWELEDFDITVRFPEEPSP